jgi:hypothetical protein
MLIIKIMDIFGLNLPKQEKNNNQSRTAHLNSWFDSVNEQLKSIEQKREINEVLINNNIKSI